MYDFVRPNGNEEEFIKMGERLKVTPIFVYDIGDKAINEWKKKQIVATYCTEKNYNKANGFIISNIIKKKVDIVIDLELQKEKDFMDARNSGLNQVDAKLAFKHECAIGFNFNNVFKNTNVILGRMLFNGKICSKYKLPIVFGSFAKTPYEMKANLHFFFKGIGFNNKLIKNSKETIKNILFKKSDKYINKYIRKV